MPVKILVVAAVSLIGLSADAAAGTGATVCLPQWLVYLLSGFAILPSGVATDYVRKVLGVEEND